MPPFENEIGDLFLMNENGEPVKIGRFSEMPRCEVKTDPHIDLRSVYECQFVLTPESAAEMARLQKQLDAEIIENLKKQISAVDAVICGLKYCSSDMVCSKCPYSGKDGIACVEDLLKDAIAIAEAYNRVLASGLEMMEKK